MRLLPREADKLALHNAGFLAQKRLARGLRLNYTEAVALIAAQVSPLAAPRSVPSVSGRRRPAIPSHVC
jgi:urease gamma subunit